MHPCPCASVSMHVYACARNFNGASERAFYTLIGCGALAHDQAWMAKSMRRRYTMPWKPVARESSVPQRINQVDNSVCTAQQVAVLFQDYAAAVKKPV